MNYAKTKASTAKKIKAKGKAITLRKKTGSFDPILGKKTPVYTDENGYALEISAKESNIDNSLIKAVIISVVDWT